jgi:LPXTG-motif cell wall-anchored protein
MIIRRLLGGAVLGLTASAAIAAPAAAAPAPTYPPAGASLSVSATTAKVGSTVTLVGNGWTDVATVTISSSVQRTQGFASQGYGVAGVGAVAGGGPGTAGGTRAAGLLRLAAPTCSTGKTCSVAPGANGAFSLAFRLTKLGTTRISASAGGITRTVTVMVVTGAGTSPGSSTNPGSGAVAGNASGLPSTGAPIIAGLLAGVILVLGGTAAIVSGRRRRRAGNAA